VANPHAVTAAQAGAVPTSRTLTAGTGLTGGGDLTANRSFAVAANGVDNTLLRDSAALSVIGRSANSTGDPADIAAGSDAQVLRRSGTTLGFGTVATAGIANDAVTDAKLRNGAACSVIGRSANSSGDPADISAATNGHVLRRLSDALGFGQLDHTLLSTIGTNTHAQIDTHLASLANPHATTLALALRQAAGLHVIGGNVLDAHFDGQSGGSGGSWREDPASGTGSGAPGIVAWRITDGGTNGGWGTVYQASFVSPTRLKNGGRLLVRFYFDGTGSAGAVLRIGWSAGIDNGTHTDRLLLEYDQAASANWRARHRASSGTDTATTIGSTAVANGWHTLVIDIGASSATFILDGVTLGTVSSAVPVDTAAGQLFAYYTTTAGNWTSCYLAAAHWIGP
jgi:hypothetical protein